MRLSPLAQIAITILRISSIEKARTNFIFTVTWLKEQKGQRTPATEIAREAGPKLLLSFFPLQGTFYVSSSASDHTGSLFNDGGGLLHRENYQT